MSDYLGHIVARLHNSGAFIRPRMGSLFENPMIAHPEENFPTDKLSPDSVTFVSQVFDEHPHGVDQEPLVKSHIDHKAPAHRFVTRPDHRPPDSHASEFPPVAPQPLAPRVHISVSEHVPEAAFVTSVQKKTEVPREHDVPDIDAPLIGDDDVATDARPLVERPQIRARPRNREIAPEGLPRFVSVPDSSVPILSEPPSPISNSPDGTPLAEMDRTVPEPTSRKDVAATVRPRSSPTRLAGTEAPTQIIGPASPPPYNAQPAPTAPTIHVTIGRVLVRAQAPTPKQSVKRSAAANFLSVDDYLKRRASRKRNE